MSCTNLGYLVHQSEPQLTVDKIETIQENFVTVAPIKEIISVSFQIIREIELITEAVASIYFDMIRE